MCMLCSHSKPMVQMVAHRMLASGGAPRGSATLAAAAAAPLLGNGALPAACAALQMLLCMFLSSSRSCQRAAARQPRVRSCRRAGRPATRCLRGSNMFQRSQDANLKAAGRSVAQICRGGDSGPPGGHLIVPGAGGGLALTRARPYHGYHARLLSDRSHPASVPAATAC